MKKYIIISILCISILTIVFSQAIFAKKNAWKYSIRPDTSEWKMLDTMEKIINTQQIRITSYNVCYTKLLRYKVRFELKATLVPVLSSLFQFALVLLYELELLHDSLADKLRFGPRSAFLCSNSEDFV